ncbi:MAG: glycoside hydrolase family 9 protein [Alphaproteobacteria bacterium]|nr:glycoside hydrolase family 9 protein [Alphaproteobacteria bacterium]
MRLPLSRRAVLMGLAAGLAPRFALAEAPGAAAADAAWWAVDLAGYLPGGAKRAVLHAASAPASADLVSLVEAESGAPAEAVPSLAALEDPVTGAGATGVDFSSLAAPGRYRLRYGDALSPVFAVGPASYDATVRALLRSFYLERCGAALSDAENDLFRRPCHTDDAALADEAGVRRDCRGGWHDGASYAKSTALVAEATLRLLALADLLPRLGANGALALPEASKGERDILSEARIGLAFLMRMQSEAGAMHGGVGAAPPSPPAAPQDDFSARRLLPPDRAATLKSAAALAMGQRAFAPADELFARALADAAERARMALEPLDRSALAGGETDRMIADLELWRSGLGGLDDAAAAAALAAIPTDDRLVSSALPLTLAMLARGSDAREAALAAQARAKLAAAVANLAPYVDLFLAPASAGASAPLARAVGLGLLFAAAARTFSRPELRGPAQRVADHMLGANAFAVSLVSTGGAKPEMAHAAALGNGFALPGFLMGALGEEHRDWYVDEASGRATFRSPSANPATAPTLGANAALAGLLAMLGADEPRSEETARASASDGHEPLAP